MRTGGDLLTVGLDLDEESLVVADGETAGALGDVEAHGHVVREVLLSAPDEDGPGVCEGRPVGS